MEKFSQAGILKCLGDHPWAEHVRFFDTVESTNNLAKTLAREGAPEGLCLIADCQTGGRGSRGRSFLSPGGQGVYFTALLRPNCAPENCMHLTCGVAVAVCRAIEEVTGLRPGIKWTNDIVLEKKKLCGILTEIAVDPATGLMNQAVVGIGINCCQHSGDFAPEIRDFAGSLQMLAKDAVDRNALAASLVRQMEKLRRELGQKDAMLAAYRARCVTLGQAVSIHRGDEITHAVAVDVDDSGALVVRDSDGTVRTVASGEVSVRGMYGYL